MSNKQRKFLVAYLYSHSADHANIKLKQHLLQNDFSVWEIKLTDVFVYINVETGEVLVDGRDDCSAGYDEALDHEIEECDKLLLSMRANVLESA